THTEKFVSCAAYRNEELQDPCGGILGQLGKFREVELHEHDHRIVLRIRRIVAVFRPIWLAAKLADTNRKVACASRREHDLRSLHPLQANCVSRHHIGKPSIHELAGNLGIFSSELSAATQERDWNPLKDVLVVSHADAPEMF